MERWVGTVDKWTGQVKEEKENDGTEMAGGQVQQDEEKKGWDRRDR